MKYLKNLMTVIALSFTLAVITVPAVPHVLAADAPAGLPAAAENVPQYLQDISVTIRADRSEGSGVAFFRDGQTFIWTAAHVVDGLRTTRMVIDPKTGSPRTVVEFKDAKIIKTLIDNGRTVGRIEMDAEIIRYSDSNHGEDLALLRVRKRDFIKTSSSFYLDDKIPPLGTRLFHVGSLLGQQGSNSMTTGIMSQHGRLIGKTVYDQTTVTAFPGSSGGGVYLEDGRYVGMLVRGAGEGFNLIVPVRRMRSWAKKAGVQWALDHDAKMPSQEELDKMPIEDVGKSFVRPGGGKATDAAKSFPFRIRLIQMKPTQKGPAEIILK
jgi:S1-C subfamily serine protease